MLVDELVAAIPALPISDHVFAQSLVSGFNKYKSFTPKQLPYVERLVAKAKAGAAPRQSVDLGNFETMIKLFAHARLKSPKVHLFIEGAEGEVELSVASERSQFAGAINVATPGGYRNNTWFGRIHKDGRFEMSSRNQPSTALVSTMQAFAAEPLKVAAEYGRLTGRCCFCLKALDNPKSVALGYGPVCAKRWA